MPTRKGCGSLYSFSVTASAKILLSSCQLVDSHTDPFQPIQVLGSPRKLVVSPSRDEVDHNLCPSQREMKAWLGNLPDTVVEDVVTSCLNNLEAQLLIDKDKKLILTLINIESIKMNDFFFGIHSLLKILRGFHINNLNISKRLWCILWEYEEILNRSLLRDAVMAAVPHLPFLSTLNLAYLADDRLMSLLGRTLPCLHTLDISNSVVTDRGLRLLADAVCPVSTVSIQPSPSVIRNLSSLLDRPVSSSAPTTNMCSASESSSSLDCLKLENLRMECCESITELGIRFVLQRYKNLRTLHYHQRSSVFEILINWSSEMEIGQIKTNVVKLEHLEHGFPYGVAPFSEQIDRLRDICPHLTSLNLVTEDYILPHLSGFQHLCNLTVEIEDYVGEGFVGLLQCRGSRFREISVSCSTDPDSASDTIEGGQQGHLFNLVVLVVATYCSKIEKVSVSGCGLISSSVALSFDLMNKLSSSQWIRSQAQTGSWFRCLEVLMLMSYEDTMPSMTIHSVLLCYILKYLPKLQILSLEGNFGSFLTDDYFSAVLSQNSFPCLRIVDICVHDQGGVQGRIPLTIVTAQSLLDKCQQLTELRMSDWNLTDSDYRTLTEQVKNNNWNLVLTRKIRSGMN